MSQLLVVVDLLGWDVAPALGLFRPNSPLLASDSVARESEVTVPTASGLPSLAHGPFVTSERYISELSKREPQTSRREEKPKRLWMVTWLTFVP